MGFKDLVAKLDDILGDHDKGKSLELEELKRLCLLYTSPSPRD